MHVIHIYSPPQWRRKRRRWNQVDFSHNILVCKRLLLCGQDKDMKKTSYLLCYELCRPLASGHNPCVCVCVFCAYIYYVQSSTSLFSTYTNRIYDYTILCYVCKLHNSICGLQLLFCSTKSIFFFFRNWYSAVRIFMRPYLKKIKIFICHRSENSKNSENLNLRIHVICVSVLQI